MNADDEFLVAMAILCAGIVTVGVRLPLIYRRVFYFPK